MSIKKVKITPRQYNQCMKCVWRDKKVDGVIKCGRINCVESRHTIIGIDLASGKDMTAYTRGKG